MIAFLAMVIGLVLLIRYMVKLEGDEKRKAVWAERWSRVSPIGRHVRADARAVRQHFSNARAARRLRRSL